MKLPRLAFFAALFGACTAAASPAGDIGGTWECRQPGVQYSNKPPILYVADSGGAQGAVDVDGFSREVYGRADVTAEDGGWWKIHPAQGPDFMIRPEAAARGTPSMALRLAGGKTDYRCLKLPPSAAPAVAPAPGQSVIPAEDRSTPAAEPQGAAMPGAQGAPPAEAPGEGSSAPKAN
ncbi:MAG: hypothetical protein WBO23_07905 [Burkholderiales bacterium]